MLNRVFLCLASNWCLHALIDLLGMIVVWNLFFPKKQGKRIPYDEKKRRWQCYKDKIFEEYGRNITSKFASEKALIKRYSEPLAFLRYRLKRFHNLDVSELSTKDAEYYKYVYTHWIDQIHFNLIEPN